MNETFPARLKRLRREQGLTQRDIAGDLLSGAYISRLEAGDRRASGKTIIQLAAKLGVTPLYLETGESSPLACAYCGRGEHPDGEPCPGCGRIVIFSWEDGREPADGIPLCSPRTSPECWL